MESRKSKIGHLRMNHISLDKSKKVCLIIIILLSFFYPVQLSVSSSSPYYYWSMDSLFGTIQGKPSVVHNDCISFACIQFDGNSAMLYGSGTTNTTVIQSQTTYSLWIETGNDTNSLQYVFTQSMIDENLGKLVVGRGVFIKDGNIWIFTRDATTTWQQIDLGSVKANIWYSIILVQDGSTLSGYLNGVETNSTISFTGSINSYTDYWGIGTLSIGGYDFIGKLDEIKVFSSPLSNIDVLSLFNSELGMNKPLLQINFSSNSLDNYSGIINHGVQIQQIDNRSVGYFNGSSYLDLGDNTTLRTDIGTVVAWIKTDTGGVIYSLGSSSTNNYYLMLLANSNGIIFYYWNNDPYNQYATVLQGNYPGISLIDNQWHQLVWQSNGNQWTGFIDGNKVNLTPATNPVGGTRGVNDGTWFDKFNGTTNSFSIGVLNRPATYNFFKGYIDELEVYNNVVFPNVNSSSQPQSSSSNDLIVNNFLNPNAVIVILLITIVILICYASLMRRKRKNLSASSNIISTNSKLQGSRELSVLHSNIQICVNCKMPIHSDDIFCQHCGERL